MGPPRPEPSPLEGPTTARCRLAPSSPVSTRMGGGTPQQLGPWVGGVPGHLGPWGGGVPDAWILGWGVWTPGSLSVGGSQTPGCHKGGVPGHLGLWVGGPGCLGPGEEGGVLDAWVHGWGVPGCMDLSGCLHPREGGCLGCMGPWGGGCLDPPPQTPGSFPPPRSRRQRPPSAGETGARGRRAGEEGAARGRSHLYRRLRGGGSWGGPPHTPAPPPGAAPPHTPAPDPPPIRRRWRPAAGGGPPHCQKCLVSP